MTNAETDSLHIWTVRAELNGFPNEWARRLRQEIVRLDSEAEAEAGRVRQEIATLAGLNQYLAGL